MKILLIAFDQTYDFIVPLLEEEGHEVRLLTKCERVPLIHSLKSTTYILEQIDEFEPELVINAIAFRVMIQYRRKIYRKRRREMIALTVKIHTRMMNNLNVLPKRWINQPILRKFLNMNTFDHGVEVATPGENAFTCKWLNGCNRYAKMYWKYHRIEEEERKGNDADSEYSEGVGNWGN